MKKEKKKAFFSPVFLFPCIQFLHCMGRKRQSFTVLLLYTPVSHKCLFSSLLPMVIFLTDKQKMIYRQPVRISIDSIVLHLHRSILWDRQWEYEQNYGSFFLLLFHVFIVLPLCGWLDHGPIQIASMYYIVTAASTEIIKGLVYFPWYFHLNSTLLLIGIISHSFFVCCSDLWSTKLSMNTFCGKSALLACVYVEKQELPEHDHGLGSLLLQHSKVVNDVEKCMIVECVGCIKDTQCKKRRWQITFQSNCHIW